MHLPRIALRTFSTAAFLAASVTASAFGQGPAASDSAGASQPARPIAATPRLGGYIQVREVAQERVGLTAFLNRARVSIDGSLPSAFSYRALVELEASAGARNPATVSLREAIVRWSAVPWTVTAGEFKTPFTREYLIPVPALELADLATAIDSIAPRYDVGVMGEVAMGATAALAVGVFNGEGANAIANRDSTVMIVARATARPLAQLGLGASAARDGADSLRWGLDATVQELGVGVRAEMLTRHVRGRPARRDEFGWTVLETLRLLPRLQLIARQEDYQRPLVGAPRRVRGAAWAAGFDVAPARARLLLELSQRWSGPRQLRADTWIAQVQAQF